jgi:hypothetical protein
MEDIFHVSPGQRVVTSHGTVRVVAFVRGKQVFAHSPRGTLEEIKVKYDALGGDSGDGAENSHREQAAA